MPLDAVSRSAQPFFEQIIRQLTPGVKATIGALGATLSPSPQADLVAARMWQEPPMGVGTPAPPPSLIDALA